MNQHRGSQVVAVFPTPLAIGFHDNSGELQIEITGHRSWYHQLFAVIPVLIFAAAFLISIFALATPIIALHNTDNRLNDINPLGATILLLILVLTFVVFPFLLLRTAWRNF